MASTASPRVLSMSRGANRGKLAALPKQPAVNKAMHVAAISNTHSQNIHLDDNDNAFAANSSSLHHHDIVVPPQ